MIFVNPQKYDCFHEKKKIHPWKLLSFGLFRIYKSTNKTEVIFKEKRLCKPNFYRWLVGALITPCENGIQILLQNLFCIFGDLKILNKTSNLIKKNK